MDPSQQREAITELKTLRDLLRYGASRFNEAEVHFGHGMDNAWDEALYLALHVLHLPLDFGNKILDARLIPSERQQIINLYSKRILQRIPVPYLINSAWFAGLEFYVDQRVLIPRSPLAEIIERQFSPWINTEIDTHEINILDIGTGSGCIAIACAYHLPSAIVDAVDISADALAVATINCKKYQLQDRVNLINSDVFAQINNKKYDIIISNPPYVDALEMANLPQEYLYEPRHALAAGQDGLDIVRKLLQQADRYLKNEGVLIVEVGDSAAALVEQFPHLPFLWLEFERGGRGVFLLRKADLNISKE